MFTRPKLLLGSTFDSTGFYEFHFLSAGKFYNWEKMFSVTKNGKKLYILFVKGVTFLTICNTKCSYAGTINKLNVRKYENVTAHVQSLKH